MAGSVRFTSLNGALVTGPGVSNEQFSPRYVWSMQVIWTSNPSVVKVTMEASFDGGVTWGVIGTFDTAASGVNGGIVSVNGVTANRVRANLVTLTGGTAPAVTAIINAEPN